MLSRKCSGTLAAVYFISLRVQLVDLRSYYLNLSITSAIRKSYEREVGEIVGRGKHLSVI